jgi:hypothetical protein
MMMMRMIQVVIVRLHQASQWVVVQGLDSICDIFVEDGRALTVLVVTENYLELDCFGGF